MRTPGPGPADRAPALLLAELPGQGGRNGLHLLRPSQTRNGQSSMGSAPVQGHGRGGGAPGSGDGLQPLQQRLRRREQPPLQGPAGARRRQRCGSALPRQQPQGQGAVGDQLDAQIPAHLRHATGGDRLRASSESCTCTLRSSTPAPPAGRARAAAAAAPCWRPPGKATSPAPAGPPALQERFLLPGGVAGRAPVQLHPIELALQPRREAVKARCRPRRPRRQGNGASLVATVILCRSCGGRAAQHWPSNASLRPL